MSNQPSKVRLNPGECGLHDYLLADESCACKFSQPEETNRDKVLRGVVVRVTDGRLADMQRDAIRNEGIAVETIYHWHWAAAITELVAARAALRRINAINDNPARFDKEIDILSAGYGIETPGEHS